MKKKKSDLNCQQALPDNHVLCKKAFVLRRTRNGWIVTSDTGYMSGADIEQSYVFETIKGVCDYLVAHIT